MPLSSGSIAFTGYNSDDPDALAFAALTDIPAGTVIFFTDNNWNGTAFATNEGTITFTATADITAGSVVSLSSLNATPVASTGTATRSGAVNFSNTGEAIYAYTGSAANPTFLTAIANSGFTATNSLTGTGLTAGVSALDLTTAFAVSHIAAYNGAHAGQATIADYGSLLNNAANWVSQQGTGSQAGDGTAPDLPFSTTPFSAGQVDVPGAFSIGDAMIVEGDSGTSPITFTVTRGSDSNVATSVHYEVTLPGGATGASASDFSSPTLSGDLSFAANEFSKTITLQVAGDTTNEADETFTVTLSAPTAGATLADGSADRKSVV